jgi:hypothetical protein
MLSGEAAKPNFIVFGLSCIIVTTYCVWYLNILILKLKFFSFKHGWPYMIWSICLDPLVYLLPKAFQNYLAFKSLNLGCTWWKIFQKRVERSKLDIYVLVEWIYLGFEWYSRMGDLNWFWLSCVGPLIYLLLYNLVFQSFDLERA